MRSVKSVKSVKSVLASFFLLNFIMLPTSALAHTDHSHDGPGIVMNDPWVRSAPPNAPALGAFVTIGNNTDQDIKLVFANASGYREAQLHRTVKADGMMKMVEQKFMPIPAQGGLQLKPGSWHIMLMGPYTVPKEGEIVPIKLHFDNGEHQTVDFKVRKGKKMNHMKHSMH